jgi:hypothetical protein
MRLRAAIRFVIVMLATCTAGGTHARDPHDARGQISDRAPRRISDRAPERDAGIGKLRMWELPAYTLVAKDGTDPRFIVQRLADTERAVSKLLATPVKPVAVPTFVWLVPRGVWNRYLAPSWAIVGEFVPRRFSNYLLIDADIPRDQLREGVQHEYTHHFLRTQWGGLYPLWFDEGVAGLMGGARLHHDRAVFEVVGTSRIHDWIDMRRLFEIDKSSREYLSPALTESVHAESWAIVHRALLSDAGFGDKMFAYLAAINRLTPADDAVTEGFGMNFAQLDASMHDYANRRVFEVGTVQYAAAARVTLPAGRVLDAGEALEGLARVMLDTGFQPDHLAEIVAAAERIEPGAPRVAMLKLRLAVRDHEDASALRLASSLRGEDLATLRDTGLALFERARDEAQAAPLSANRRAQFEDAAFGLLDRALRIDASDAAAAWGYALLAVRRHEGIDVALERLAAARARMPGHPDLAEATALALEATGKEDAMMPWLLESLRNTGSAEQRARTARRIGELRISERLKAPL